MKEIWKDIPNYKGYKVSNLGKIKSFLTNPKGRILNERKDKDGYSMVWTKYNSATRVHRVVALTFLKESYKDGLVVNHKNGIKSDNRVDNLEWVTISENTKHGYEMNLSHSVRSTGVAVLHNGETISVFNSYSKLARHMGVSRNLISQYTKSGELLFDELTLKTLGNERFDNHPMFEKPFVKTKLSKYQSRPCKHLEKYYESIKELSEDIGIERKTLTRALEKREIIKGGEMHFITRYEYIKQ